MKKIIMSLTLIISTSAFSSLEYTDFFGDYEMISGSNCIEQGYDSITVGKQYFHNTYNDNVGITPHHNTDYIRPDLNFYAVNMGPQTHGSIMGSLITSRPCSVTKATLVKNKLKLKEKSCGLSLFYSNKVEMILEDDQLVLKYFHDNEENAFECLYLQI